MRRFALIRVPFALAGAVGVYAKTAWWGIAKPRLTERRPLVVAQAVIVGQEGVLLAVRSDLRGWELPGGTVEPGEAPEEAVVREVEEETGLRIAVDRHVGDWMRTGFRPHTAKVYRCRVLGGRLEGNWETRALRWFDPQALPGTFFPWFHDPMAVALSGSPDDAPVERFEHQGAGSVMAGMRIDLAMRCSDDEA